MRGLKAAVIIMGVLIVVGVIALALAVTQKFGAASSPTAIAAAAVLDEPPGTRIASTSLAADRLSLVLTGGGPDRVVVFDLTRGRIAGRVSLAH